MKHIILGLAVALSLAAAARADWPDTGRRHAHSTYGGATHSAHMHVYFWPNGAYGFSSPTIDYGFTPATVYSPYLYSPYSFGGYGGYGLGGYGWGGGF
ncbi:MAG TPA: hypothetical protein PK867_11470 [Pirellulales bacterium]|nr:hypothetical protein [Pirellulales bacterium]